MNSDITNLFDSIKTEAFFIWSCLTYFEQWFGEGHQKEYEILTSKLPMFCAMQQRMLLDSALLGISRLMDKKETGRGGSNKNLSIDRLVSEINNQELSDELNKLHASWKQGDHKDIKDFRDHFLAHLDYPSRSEHRSTELVKYEYSLFLALKDIFCKIYSLLSSVNHILGKGTLLEPSYQDLSMRPERLVALISEETEDANGIQQREALDPVHKICQGGIYSER